VGPGRRGRPHRAQSARVVPEAGGHRDDLLYLKPGGPETRLDLGGGNPAERATPRLPLPYPVKALALDPRLDRTERCDEQASDRTGGEPVQIPRTFARTRDELDEKLSPGTDERGGSGEQGGCVALGKSEDVAQHRDPMELAGAKGRGDRIALDEVESGVTSPSGILLDPLQHRPRKLEEGDPVAGVTNQASETAGPGTNLEAPARRRRPVALQEALPQLTVEVAERSSFVPSPFAFNPVVIPFQETVAPRQGASILRRGSGGGNRTSRSRTSWVSGR